MSGLPCTRVIGSGTILDTARFRYLIGRHFRVDPRSVHAHIIGEHGDSSVAIWSSASIAGVPLAEAAKIRGVAFDDSVREGIARDVRDAAYAIVAGKGATYYAIASGMVRLVEAVLRDQRTVRTVSNRIGAAQGFPELEGVWLSLPAVIDHGGIDQTLPLTLDANERAALLRSAEVLRAARKLVG